MWKQDLQEELKHRLDWIWMQIDPNLGKMNESNPTWRGRGGPGPAFLLNPKLGKLRLRAFKERPEVGRK